MKDCARKKKAKIPESRRFFWRYKRTYDLDKYNLHVNCLNNMFTNTNYTITLFVNVNKPTVCVPNLGRQYTKKNRMHRDTFENISLKY